MLTMLNKERDTKAVWASSTLASSISTYVANDERETCSKDPKINEFGSLDNYL